MQNSNSGFMGMSDAEKNLKILQVEQERDQLKWSKERETLLNRINEYQELIKAKDFEIKNKEEQVMLKYRDEVADIE